MLKSETRECGGLKVTTTQLPAMRGFRLFARVGKILAPTMSNLQGLTARELKGLMDADVAALAPMVANLFAQLEDSDSLFLELFASTKVERVDENGVPRLKQLTDQDAINYVFAGNLAGMLSAAMFVLEINFADFIRGALGKVNVPSVPTPATPVAPA